MPKINIGKLNINFESEGSGYPIVFIHGHGSNLHFFDGLASYLKRDYTVYRYDQRGYGLTDKPLKPPYSTELWAEDLYWFFKKLGIKKAILGGHSMSGRILVTFTVSHPEMVEGLISLNCTWFGSNPKVSAELERDVSKVERDGMSAAVEWSPMVNAVPKSIPSIAELERGELLKNDPKSYALAMRAVAKDFGGDSREELLKALECPTLILIGDRDSAPLEGAIKMYKGIKNSRLAVIPFSGHCSILERPEISKAVIKDFVNEIKSSTPK